MRYKSKIVRLTSKPMQEGVAQLFKDLAWSPERQKGFCQRQIKRDAPRTNVEAAKVYHGLEEMLKRRFSPYYGAFQGLVMRLMSIRAEMTPWERDMFLPDIFEKMNHPDKISPAMVKKVREIAHKYGAPCGFPNFRELAAAQTTQEKHDDKRQRNGSHLQDNGGLLDRTGQPQRRQDEAVFFGRRSRDSGSSPEED